MLNNEFRFIGTIVSEFEKGGTEAFPKYFLTIEVEKRKKGVVSQYKLIVYEKNNVVDFTKSLVGKQAIVTGYIDEYKGNLQLITQDLIVVGAIPEAKPELDTTPISDDLPF